MYCTREASARMDRPLIRHPSARASTPQNNAACGPHMAACRKPRTGNASLLVMGTPAGARARRARYNSRIKRHEAAAGGAQRASAIGGSPRYQDVTTYRTYRKAKGASMPRDDRRSNYSSSRGSDNRRSDGNRGYGDRRYGGSDRDRGYSDGRGYGDRTRDNRGYSDSRGYGDRDRNRDDRNHGGRGYRDRDDRRERRDGRGYRDEERPNRDRREQYGDFDIVELWEDAA